MVLAISQIEKEKSKKKLVTLYVGLENVETL
jgi:hypothetical protein